MLRLWLDEMISPSVAQGLPRRGIDARAAQGTPETTEFDDAEQLAEAVHRWIAWHATTPTKTR